MSVVTLVCQFLEVSCIIHCNKSGIVLTHEGLFNKLNVLENIRQLPNFQINQKYQICALPPRNIQMTLRRVWPIWSGGPVFYTLSICRIQKK